MSSIYIYAPFKKYFPPLVSKGSWELRKEILRRLKEIIIHTREMAEGLMLKIYRLKPRVGQRKELSATSVKNEMYKSALERMENGKTVPKSVAEKITKNWYCRRICIFRR